MKNLVGIDNSPKTPSKQANAKKIINSLRPICHNNNQEMDLERNDKVKDLGVWFDEKLSFR